jgi:hypothetical protein
MVPVRVQKERDDALKDVSDIVNEYGEEITLIVREESNISRDKYGSIKCAQVVPALEYKFKALPVDHNPDSRKMEKAGIREECNVIAWISMKDVLDKGLDYGKIDAGRFNVIIHGETYNITEKGKAGEYADEHLYITLGLAKR